MESLPFNNPLDSWLPYQIAFFIGFVICIRTYMLGPDCPSNAHIKGKTVILTGGSTGIGKQVALELARRGGRIILACRDTDKGGNTAEYIRKESKNNDIHVLHLDLSSFKSVHQFVENFINKFETLDILINNAAVMMTPFTKTEDGQEQHFQVNYLSHFLLTHLFLEKLKNAPSGRIINVSALAHRAARMHFDDFSLEANYSGREAYGQSKLAQVLFTRHLSKQLKDTTVTVNAVHPGIVKNTELLRHTSLYNSIYLTIAAPLTWLFLKTPKAGSQTIVYLAVAPELQEVTGKYFSDCQVKEPSKDAIDDEVAEKLWNESMKLTKLSAQ